MEPRNFSINKIVASQNGNAQTTSGAGLVQLNRTARSLSCGISSILEIFAGTDQLFQNIDL